MASIPPIVRLIRSFQCTCGSIRDCLYRYSVLILTFMFYTSYHLSRKPISIVKGELHRNCSNISEGYNIYFGSHSGIQLLHQAPEYSHNNSYRTSNDTWCDWAPFDKPNYKSLYGALDYAFLFTYAIAMFISGYVGERMPLRYFLGFGMIFCGIFTSLFGFGHFWNIHALWFYILVQVLNGFFQTTGWPGVVAAVGKWFGKGRRGFIMGVWNSHTSVGNILGSIIAAKYVQTEWAWSFIVPGIIIGSMGILCLLTLVEHPEDVGCSPPVHEIDEPSTSRSFYQPIPTSEQDDADQQYIVNGFEDASVLRRSSTENLIGDPNLNPESKPREEKAVGILTAVLIPGVIEFSLCLLFAKLVSYTFLFWLPLYIQNNSNLDVKQSGLMSTLFDIGGIVGGITAGVISDAAGDRAVTCGFMLIIGAVMMFLYNAFGNVSNTINIVLLLITGAFVNGPYALITTAVSADLGTHSVLEGNSKALATVTAIIDGTGSIGAAIGPLLTGIISPHGWNKVFYMLIASNIAACLLLTRLIIKEISGWSCCKRTSPRSLFAEVAVKE
uniref:glucose-6-phosphate exchanger SLC37A2-like isoform X1 n=1 Tax=Styela clava TaxID=7725 RepID=UPI00193A81DA|nr:glucose-6-phosphate exchanger SLC37A2-like isoform X1 [Styela clava]